MAKMNKPDGDVAGDNMSGFSGDGSKNGERTGRPRGFAAMDPGMQKEIASKGGKAVSDNRQYMAEIGRRGGVASHGGGRRPASESQDTVS